MFLCKIFSQRILIAQKWLILESLLLGSMRPILMVKRFKEKCIGFVHPLLGAAPIVVVYATVSHKGDNKALRRVNFILR